MYRGSFFELELFPGKREREISRPVEMAGDEEDMPRTLAALERNMLASQQMLREVVAHQRQAFDDDPSPHARRMCGTVMLWCTELLGAQDAGTACRACASHVRASVTHTR